MLFQLFKNKYLDLTTSFNTQTLALADCIILSSEFDDQLSQVNSRVLRRAPSLHALLTNDFHSELKEFFAELHSYQSDKPVIIYCSKHDFTYLVLQYLKDLYPSISSEQLETLYYGVTDRISLILPTVLNPTSPNFLKGMLEVAVTESELKSLVGNLMPKGIFTPAMLTDLPFEYLFGDYKARGKGSPAYSTVMQYIRTMVLNDIRNWISDARVSMLSLATDFQSYFPEMEAKRSIYESYKTEPFLQFCFDPLVANMSKAEDVLPVLEKYGDTIAEYCVRCIKCAEGTATGTVYLATNASAENRYTVKRYEIYGTEKLTDLVKMQMRSHFERRLTALKTAQYEGLLNDSEVQWLDLRSQEYAYKKRINFILVNYFKKCPLALSLDL